MWAWCCAPICFFFPLCNVKYAFKHKSLGSGSPLHCAAPSVSLCPCLGSALPDLICPGIAGPAVSLEFSKYSVYFILLYFDPIPSPVPVAKWGQVSAHCDLLSWAGELTTCPGWAHPACLSWLMRGREGRKAGAAHPLCVSSDGPFLLLWRRVNALISFVVLTAVRSVCWKHSCFLGGLLEHSSIPFI